MTPSQPISRPTGSSFGSAAATPIRGTTSRRPWPCRSASARTTPSGRTTGCAAAQHADGAWFNYYWADRVKDERRDTNTIAYVAVGVWHHFLLYKDTAWLEAMFPMVDRAIRYVLDLQQDSGEVLWCREPDGVTTGDYGLLTGSSSIYFSLRCAIAIAERLDDERPEWELAAGALAHAIQYRPEVFADKSRWAMDWYYPVLSGALTGDERARAASATGGTSSSCPARAFAACPTARGSPRPRPPSA